MDQQFGRLKTKLNAVNKCSCSWIFIMVGLKSIIFRRACDLIETFFFVFVFVFVFTIIVYCKLQTDFF